MFGKMDYARYTKKLWIPRGANDSARGSIQFGNECRQRTTEWFKLTVDAKQRCVLSRDLFNLRLEAMTSVVVTLNDQKLNNQHCADYVYIDLVSESPNVNCWI